MSFFNREKRAESAPEVLTTYFPNTNVTVKLALQVPVIAYCVEMISGAIGSLPIKLYRKNGNEVEEITDDIRLKMLNTTTGDTLNADAMRRVWVRDYLLYGNAYAVIEKEKGIASRLYYIPPMHIGTSRDNIDYVHKSYSYYINGVKYEPSRVLKILRNSDGFGEGFGIVEEEPLIIDTIIQLLKFQRTQVLKGGNKRGFLKTVSPVRDEIVEKMKRKWERINSNENRESFMLLNGDIDFKEMSSTSVEMQMNESYTTNSGEIMKLFGTNDGILSDETVKNAVMPVIDVFEAAFDADLLTEAERSSGMYFAFDTKELTRGDIATRYNAYATALSSSFMQLDEVRAMEDLPPMDFNYIKLGLNDVLLDPKTNKIYTPNTNAMVDFGKNGIDNTENSGIIEDRADHATYDDKHRFTGSMPRTVRMSKVEKRRVSSGILTDHPNYEKDSAQTYEYGDYFYAFTVRGYGDYEFLAKLKISDKNESRIRFIKEYIYAQGE